MIGKKYKINKDIEYFSHFSNKSNEEEIPSHLSDSEIESFFSKDIKYTRGFMSSLNWFGRNVSDLRTYSAAKKVSDAYEKGWDELLIEMQNETSQKHNMNYKSAIWDQSFRIKKQNLEDLEADRFESWDSSTNIKKGFSLDEVLTEQFF